MNAALARFGGLAAATWRGIVRHPGAWLALAGTATLVLIVPRLARRALDDGAALGSELVLSTVWLHATVLAALVASRAASPGTALGPVPELLATPLRQTEYVMARAAGIVGAALTHALLLLLLGWAALYLSGDGGALSPVLPAALVAGALQTLVFAACGLLAGAALGADLGAIAIVAFVIAARVAIPALSETGAWWASLIPDPGRLDISREAAFARPIGGSALAAALGAGALQALALLCLARAALSRERIGAERDGA